MVGLTSEVAAAAVHQRMEPTLLPALLFPVRVATGLQAASLDQALREPVAAAGALMVRELEQRVVLAEVVPEEH